VLWYLAFSKKNKNYKKKKKKKKRPPLKILLSCPLMPAPFFVNAAAFEDFLHLHQSFTN